METGGEVSRSESTTVGFILSDEDILDSIGVQVYTDPVYGTPVFVTTGGWTVSVLFFLLIYDLNYFY